MADDNKTPIGQSEAEPFAIRLATSNTFQTLFEEGMALVEETAIYLDGEGRTEAKHLERPASLAYATESMRLTTRLMQLASWLLLQRAVNDGEMSKEQAGSEKNKVRLDRLSSATQSPVWDELPKSLTDLISRSIRLQERIVHIDKMLYSDQPAQDASGNPVAAQLDQLQAAFGRAG